MNLLEKISQHEYHRLLKFPVYISLLAANADGSLDNIEKKEAAEFTHIKTYSSDPLLADFYKDVETTFIQNIEQLDSELPKERTRRNDTIKAELENLEPIIAKLGEDYTELIHKSMKAYANHVSKSHNNILASFIIPFNIKGLTDI